MKPIYENKEFSATEEGDLKAEIITKNKLFIPGKKKKSIEIGIVEQETIHLIPKEKIHKFIQFLKEQKEQIILMVEQTEEQLKALEHVDVNLIPEKEMNLLNKEIPELITAALGNKDTSIKRVGKELRTRIMKLTSLDKAIKEINQKKQLIQTLNQNKELLKEVNSDWDKLNSVNFK